MQKRGLALLLALVMLLGAAMPAAAWADDAADEKKEEAIVRLAGTNRYETAVKVSQDAFTKADVAVVASGESFPDALAGGQLARALNAPILLTEQGKLPEATTDELTALKTKTVYILGGTATVSSDVASALEKMNLKVERLEGTNRYETALKIAAEARLQSGIIADTTIVASGVDGAYADALASGGVVALNRYSLALSSGNELPELNTKKWLALGGERYLPLEGNKDKVTRTAGTNRYETALKLAKDYFKDPKVVVLASGENYADALTAISAAAKYNAPILLTAKKGLDKDTKAYIEKSAEKVIIVGGDSWIPDDVVKDLKLKAVTPKITFNYNFEKAPADKVVQSDEKGKVPYQFIKREGYVFRGWYENKEGTGNAVNLYEKEFDKDTTLYAKWEEGEEVVLTMVWGYNSITRIAQLKKDESFELTDPKRDGYVFTEWVKKVSGNEVPIAGDKIDVNEDTTIYATWEAGVTVTLKYNIKDKEDETITIAKGSNLDTTDKKLNPTRDGYRLVGWQMEVEKDKYRYEDLANMRIKADTILYAGWQETVKVVLKYNDLVKEDVTLTLDKGASLNKDMDELKPSREDYTLDGWYKVGATEKFDFDKEKFNAKETVLVAHWTSDNKDADFVFVEDTKTITGYKGEIKNVRIPAEINDVAVEIIGVGAFKDKDLKSVEFPTSLKTIEKDAFTGNKLTSVEKLEGVTVMEGAFDKDVYKGEYTKPEAPETEAPTE